MINNGDIVPPQTLTITSPSNATHHDNVTAATLVAGSILHQSIFSTIFAYFISGLFVNIQSWWQLSDSSEKRKGATQWHPIIGPDGERSVPVRNKSILDSWALQAPSLSLTPSTGLIKQDDNSDNKLRTDDEAKNGGLRGPQWSHLGNWANETEEQEQSDLRTQLKNQLNGSYDAVPRYILDHAPLVYLYSKEEFWPGDIDFHLKHVIPRLNLTPITSPPPYPDLDNLPLLNTYAPHIYLTSEDDIESHPSWLSARFNIPVDGYSKAPATLIWIDKGNGVVDAFWFFFYSYNLGNIVFNVRFGNHVGDWEHTMMRFVDGEPKWMFLSQHSGGDAYTFDAVEKKGKRVCLPLEFR